jgi:hypothetical protein
MRIVLSVLAFLLAMLFFGATALELLIAYKVHQTGQFHGMPGFHVGESLRYAGICFTAMFFFVWTGIRFVRR